MSSIRRGTWLGVLACALALTGAPGAGAATYQPSFGHQQHAPITLPGEAGAEFPTVAVDTDGTGYIAWDVNTSTADKVVLCKLPRGATTCALTHTFQPADGLDQNAAKVLLAGPGHPVVVFNRCCTTPPTDHTYVSESSDGGVTWTTPKDVGTIDPEDAQLGPGPYLISGAVTSSGTYARYQAMDRRGPKTTADAPLGTTSQQYYEGGIGFADSTTPIFAFTNLADVFYRTYDTSKGTNYNNAANWSAQKTIPDAAEPRLASGQSGTALLTLDGDTGDERYAIRHYDRQSQAFGAPTVVSETGYPNTGTVFQDGGGGLEVLWIDGDDTVFPQDGAPEYPVRAAYAADGQHFTQTRTLLDATQDLPVYHLKVAAAPDGGGFAVYDDDNGTGRIAALIVPPGGAPGIDAPPPPPAAPGGGGGTPTPAPAGPSTPNCTYLLKVSDKVQARASGCFAKSGQTYTTKNDVRVNGIDFLTGGTSTITVDPGAHTIDAGAGVQQKAGAVLLHTGAVSWKVTGTTSFTGLAGAKVKVLGFPVTGDAKVDFVSGGANVHVTLALPFPFEDVTSNTVVKTTMNDGLLLDGLTIDVPTAFVGPLVVQDLHVAYVSSAATFEGSAQFVLPPDASKPVGVDFGFEDGQFAHAGVHDFTGPPLPIVLAPPGILLNSLGFEVSVKDGFLLSGEAGIGAGPEVGGASAVGIDGGFTFAIPKGASYATLTIGGVLRVMGLKIASANATFDTRGQLTFDGQYDFDILEPVLGAHVKVHGLVDVTQPAFEAEGDVKLCAPSDCQDVLGIAHLEAGASLLISTKGLGACGNALGDSFGVVEVFGSDPEAYLDDCDSDGFAKVGVTARAHAAQVAPRTFTVKPGERQVDLQLTGTTGPPAVTVTGPGGRVVGSLAGHPEAFNQDGRGGLVFPARARAGRPPTTTILIAKPAPGTWTVTPQDASGFTTMSVARALPVARVTASVHHVRGRSFVLTYKNANLAGRTVTFAEQGAGGVLHPLGATRRSAGTLRFAAADGPGGTRRIVATLVNRDIPARATTPARFTAPPPVVPGRARALRIRRSGTRATITWGAATGAALYRVQVTLSDGRRIQTVAPARHRRVVVPAVAKATRATVTVAGRSARGAAGPRATARLAAVKVKTKAKPRKKAKPHR